MDYLKKHLFSSCAISLCAVCIVSLMGCQNTTKETEYYADYYDEQTVDENTTYNMSETTSSIPVVYENATVVNPYQAQETTEFSSSQSQVPFPCQKVQNGQIVMENTQNTTPPCMKNASLPCPCAQKAEVETQKEMSCGCNKEKTLVENQNAQSINTTVVNIETPARCQIALHNNEIMSSVPLKNGAFDMVRMDKSDALPRYEVNDYTFKDMPLDLAIQNLVSEAGIRVYSDDALFPEVSGEHIRGELTAVIDELTAAGDVFYRYNASQKQLILSRWARFVMHVPGGRIGMYTVLDALRGANITNLQPDFGTNEIYMRVNTEKKKTILELVNAIKQSPSLLLFDIQVYRLTKINPNIKLDWQNLVQNFGVTRINSSVNGIMGRILSMKHQPNNRTIIDMLKPYGSVNVISEGVAVMPNDWKVRFDIGQCTKFQTPEQNLSMLFQSSILSENRAESNIALDTPNGEITAFHAVYNIDDMLNVIGIPGKVFNPAWGDNIEYIITLKPRMVRLVK